MKRFIQALVCSLSLTTFFAQGADSTFTVCSWNLRNFGLSDTHMPNGRKEWLMKSEHEIGAEMAILKKINPDVLGVNEVVQEPNDRYLKLLQKRLRDVGLDYPYLSTSKAGQDSRIQNALFSRFPLKEDHSADTQTFDVEHISRDSGEAAPFKMHVERGLIHCLVQVKDGPPIHVLLVHLKSRIRSSSIVDLEHHQKGDRAIRYNEAALVHNAVAAIYQSDAKPLLIVMGDFNDTSRSPTLKTILDSTSATPLQELGLHDYLGDAWTHFYEPDNDYTQIDHMLVSEALGQHFQANQSYLYRKDRNDPADLDAYTASDHRPLVAVFTK